MISSLLRPLRGIVCVSSAGLAGPSRKSQIARFSPFRCTDSWVLGHGTEDLILPVADQREQVIASQAIETAITTLRMVGADLPDTADATLTGSRMLTSARMFHDGPIAG